MTIERVLMCPPDHFDIEYSINPWMDVGNRVDHDLAARQWQRACALLTDLGVAVDVIDPVPGLPDMTFAGDCGMVVDGKVLLSRFRHEERAPEANAYRRWFEEHGYEVVVPPADVYFEGLGDIVMAGGDVLFGHGPRSSPGAADVVRSTFPHLRVVGEVALAGEEFFHTGLAAALLDPSTVMYHPPAFTPESCALFEEVFPVTIPVGDHDARTHFACNNIPIGSTVLLDGCSDELRGRLREAGFEAVTCDMSEFKKSGGSIRCLIVAI